MSGAFTYFGEEFAYSEEFPAFEFAEFQECLADDEGANSGRSTGVALRLAVACVADADRNRFRKVSRQNRAKVDDWLVVFRDWTAGEAERPTGLPSDSSTGPTLIPESSASQPIALVTSLTEHQDAKPVRGDLALAVVRSAG